MLWTSRKTNGIGRAIHAKVTQPKELQGKCLIFGLSHSIDGAFEGDKQEGNGPIDLRRLGQ